MVRPTSRVACVPPLAPSGGRTVTLTHMRTAFLILTAVGLASTAWAQESPAPLLQRWIGRYDNQPLALDFYDDTMVVVNDQFAASFRATYDSLAVFGDTSFTVAYWFSMGRLLLQTRDGKVVTMSRQSDLARPIEGLWRGSSPSDGQAVVIQMWRGGAARRRTLPEGAWIDGQWDRNSRMIQFTWRPDSTTWTATYDPLGQALLFTDANPTVGTLVLRKVYR